MDALKFAENYLIGKGCDARIVRKYAPRLAALIDDTAADFVTDDMSQMLYDEERAAEDAYWEHKIDEYQEGK